MSTPEIHINHDVTNVVANEVPRGEHPNPQFYRPSYQSLNGQWEFAFDDANIGLQERWQHAHAFEQTITVPFAFQSSKSGIGDTDFHDVVWYRRAFEVPAKWAGKRILLHFGAVDYTACVWVNGEVATTHQGGHTPFHADVTDLLVAGDNIITIRAEDFSRDLTLARGKQYWEKESASIFYTRTTGIWQSVWLEAVSSVHIKTVKATPQVDHKAFDVFVQLGGWESAKGRAVFEVEVRFDQRIITRQSTDVAQDHLNQQISVELGSHEPMRLWSPEHPHLYDVTYSLVIDGQIVDRVESYVGMRKIAIENGKVFLNNHPYYMRLVLDQGYFPDGNLTPPSDDAIRRDVELIKELGFNGARKHQKVEDPRYLYWCDRLGLLVWGEMANAYTYSEQGVARLTAEWQEALARDYNHPCIVAWVPLNESWGTPQLLSDPRQRAFLASLYHLTKAIDPTRLVISNDGWEHVVSDLCTIHDYEPKKDALMTRYASPDRAVTSTPGGKLIFAPGSAYDGAPILVSEMGGISFKKSEWNGWGYSTAQSEEDFIQRYAQVIEAMHESPVIQGFCYTQLTDVEQEINGLLTYDRMPKAPLEVIRAITEGRRKTEGE